MTSVEEMIGGSERLKRYYDGYYAVWILFRYARAKEAHAKKDYDDGHIFGRTEIGDLKAAYYEQVFYEIQAVRLTLEAELRTIEPAERDPKWVRYLWSEAGIAADRDFQFPSPGLEWEFDILLRKQRFKRNRLVGLPHKPRTGGRPPF